ncbi:MAG: 50S ribosomal protein L32 [Candidatus Vogelbacteria bacterium]|nr:50S ribosomal protein L32 [Candidatus Vogelbacteria bacterium]
MVNRMRHTRAHTANRRSHHALKAPNLSTCPKCQAPYLRHRACPNCGTYKGIVVIDTTSKIVKKSAKSKAE